MLRTFRIIAQSFFFTLFCLLFFVFTSHPHAYSFPGDLFLRLNPLTALLTEIAARAIIHQVFITGLAVVLLTMVFGRFFCGFMCPLGAVIDVADTLLFRKFRPAHRRPPRVFQQAKYVLLFVLVILSLFGALSPFFMDPVALLTRFMTIIINPLFMFAGAGFFAWTEPLWSTVGLEQLRTITIKTPFYYGMVPTVLFFLLAVAGSLWDRRFWCQYLCPSGALFGLLSRAPLYRRFLSKADCTSCGACAGVCPTRAIDAEKPEQTNGSECIVCGLCTQIRKSCGTFRFGVPRPAAAPGPDLSRRHFVFGAVGGLLITPLFKINALNKLPGNGRLIRPPGAMPENEFLARCIACGNCMKVCPTNALQPCTPGDGFNRLFTPKLVPRIGACDFRCRLCGYTCPTGAIRRISRKEKPYIKIGTAVLDRHRCIAWEQNRVCLVCDEVCPYNAIEALLVQTTRGPCKVPVVREEVCVGCGMCEKQCPVSGRSAIEVISLNENRFAAGPYPDDRMKRKIDSLRKKTDRNVFSAQPPQ